MGERPSQPDLTTVRGRRRLIIDICQRRQRPGTGSNLASLMEGRYRMSWPDLASIFEPIPWAVIGAVATRQYMPERATQDLDVAVRGVDADEVRHRLSAHGWRHMGELTIGGSTWEGPEGERLDVVEGREAWWETALQQAQDNRDRQGLPVLPLSYLVLTKLKAGRLHDIGDLGRMLGLADERALQEVREVVAREAPEDAEDLESLIALGKLEAEPGP